MNNNAVRSRGRIAGSFDPNAIKMQRVMYLDFANTSGSAAFIDRCGNFTFSNVGSPYLDTSTYYSGSSSGYFNGSSAIVATSNKLLFLGDNDWMLAFAFKRNDATTGPSMCGQCNSSVDLWSGNIGVRFSSSNYIQSQAFYGNNLLSILSNAAMTDTSSWHFLKFLRERNTLKMYLDGVLQAATADMTSYACNFSINNFAIGRRGETTSGYFKGWIDEFELWNGIRSY